MDREEVLQKYRRAIERHADIEVKGAKTPYTALNGNMFSFIDDEDHICLRFSEDRKAALKQEFGLEDVVQYGAVMRGYVQMPNQIIEDQSLYQRLFSESLEFAKSLKPKPTKKGKVR